MEVSAACADKDGTKAAIDEVVTAQSGLVRNYSHVVSKVASQEGPW
jgi:hypothetical protein